jgi:hypothetical protein
VNVKVGDYIGWRDERTIIKVVGIPSSEDLQYIFVGDRAVASPDTYVWSGYDDDFDEDGCEAYILSPLEVELL